MQSTRLLFEIHNTWQSKIWCIIRDDIEIEDFLKVSAASMIRDVLQHEILVSMEILTD